MGKSRQSKDRKKKKVDVQKRAEDYLRQAQHIARLGCWEWDIRKNRLWWSDDVYDLFGMSAGEKDLNLERVLSFVHPSDRTRMQQSVDRALGGQENYLIEYRIVRPDGEARTVCQRGEVTWDASGQPVQVFGTIQDVTDERRKDLRLRKQEAELHARADLLDLAHDVIIVHDLEGRITYWNHGAETAYGFRRDEVLGKITHELLKTRFQESLLKIMASVSTRGYWEGEVIQYARDGREVRVESRWGLQRDKEGRPQAIIEIERDVTARWLAQKKTEEARQYAESIVETIQEALVILDAELKIVSANHAYYHMFGSCPSQIEGRSFYAIHRSRWDVPALKKQLESVLPRSTSFDGFEIPFEEEDGPTRTLLLNARGIRTRGKKTEMILLVIQDVTYRKQQENRIRKLTERLLLSEEDQRQQIATALHDSIGQMLAFAKREISAMVKDPALRTGPRLEKVLDSIGRCVRESRRLTAELSSPTLYTLGLVSALEELAEQFTEAHAIACTVNAPVECPALEKRVMLVLFRSVKELLSNVAKHAQARQVRIDIARMDACLEVRLADDGKGFEASQPSENPQDSQSLGLFGIEQHLIPIGGSCHIESQLNRGTTVVLQVPLSPRD